jgi:hypothetical protein
MVSQRAQVAWNRLQDELKNGQAPPPIRVSVSKYLVQGRGRIIPHFYLRLAGEPLPNVHDNRELPRYLFLGAGLLTLGVLLILINLLRDLPKRSVWVLRSIGKERLRVDGILHLPGHGPVILATNAATVEQIEHVAYASDRMVHFLHPAMDPSQGRKWLDHGHVVGVTVTPAETTTLDKLRAAFPGDVTLLPVQCGGGHVRFGAPLPANVAVDQVLGGIDQARAVEDH